MTIKTRAEYKAFLKNRKPSKHKKEAMPLGEKHKTRSGNKKERGIK